MAGAVMGGWKAACDGQRITSDRWQELAAGLRLAEEWGNE